MDTVQLHELLQKCLSGAATSGEWEELRKELESPRHSALREELFRFRQFSTDDVKADQEKIWENIRGCREKGHNRLKRSQRVLRYAAVVALPLLLGSGILWIQFFAPRESPVVTARIEPGYPRAILTLDNGERIDLSGKVKDTLLIREGVAIRLDSSQGIQYQPGYGAEPTAAFNTLTVPKGGEYRLVLSDGTVVWLNADSELKYPVAFAENRREVFLKGEGYFEVAKNTAAPFLVKVADMEVKVLGTRFNINAYRKDGVFQTTLVNGKVEVADLKTAKKVVLKPDQQALVKNGQLLVRDVDAAAFTAWRDGKFYFESETLEEIAAQLERWYDVHFVFGREELKRYEFTGVIRKDYTAGQMLGLIAKTTNVRFEVVGKKIKVE